MVWSPDCNPWITRESCFCCHGPGLKPWLAFDIGQQISSFQPWKWDKINFQRLSGCVCLKQLRLINGFFWNWSLEISPKNIDAPLVSSQKISAMLFSDQNVWSFLRCFSTTRHRSRGRKLAIVQFPARGPGLKRCDRADGTVFPVAASWPTSGVCQKLPGIFGQTFERVEKVFRTFFRAIGMEKS